MQPSLGIILHALALTLARNAFSDNGNLSRTGWARTSRCCRAKERQEVWIIVLPDRIATDASAAVDTERSRTHLPLRHGINPNGRCTDGVRGIWIGIRSGQTDALAHGGVEPNRWTGAPR